MFSGGSAILYLLKPDNSLASEGRIIDEICHGWIFDIWHPVFIFEHQNKNPEGGPQTSRNYLIFTGKTLVFIFFCFNVLVSVLN